eukprot:6832348-Lingulodinium_polyedra.AAC.1
MAATSSSSAAASSSSVTPAAYAQGLSALLDSVGKPSSARQCAARAPLAARPRCAKSPAVHAVL